MSNVTVRELAGRWFVGQGLKVLERVLGIVHSAVEYPAPTVGSRVACTSTTAITTTTDADITGATITIVPEVDMSIMVWANFEIACSLFGSVTHAFSGALIVNGTALDGRTESTVRSVDDARSICGSWIVPMVSGTSYTVKLQAKTSNVGTTFNVFSVNSWFTYLNVPNLFKVP